MSNEHIVGILSICGVTTGLVFTNLFMLMMIAEINRKREEGNLVSYFGFDFPKMQKVFGEYRRTCPTGRLHLYALISFAFAAACLIGVAKVLGLFG